MKRTPDFEGRQRVAGKSSGSSYLTVSDVSTRASGGSASPQLKQQPRSTYKQQQQLQVQRPSPPRLLPPYDRRMQRSEGEYNNDSNKQRYHNNAKRILTGSLRNKKDQPHEQQPQRGGKEEYRGTETESIAFVKEIVSAEGKSGALAAFQHRTETTAPATVDSTGSRVPPAIKEKINFRCAGRGSVEGGSGAAAGQRKGPLYANSTTESAAQQQPQHHHHQAATQKPVRRERRYYH